MSQQTQPPSASTADGNFLRSSKKRKGIWSLIRREPDGQGAVSSANSPTKAAPQQTAPAPPLTRALVNADHRGIQGRQGVAKAVPQKHQRDEQRRSDAAPTGNSPPEKRPEKPPPKEQIDGIDAELYHKLVSEIGAPARRKKKINATLADKMRRAGWSYRQIAEHFGVSSCTVRRRLREAGLLK
jgi:transcriptional regulator of acetoin/glycerol metabolism